MSERRVVESVDGVALAYDVQGSGPVLVLVPGVTTDRSLWHRAGYVERLADRFTVVTVDPLGHGDSDRPHDPVAYGNDRLVTHLVAVLDAEGVDRCAVWGYSRGGLIGSLLAWSYPERVSLLALGGTPLHHLTSSLPMPVDELAVDALMAGDWGPWWAQSPPLPDEVRTAVEAGNDPRAISAALQGRTPTELRPFTAPTLSYLGDGDSFVGDAQEAAESIGVPTAVLRTGGHAQTFMALDVCLQLVEPFLEAAGS